MAGGVAAWPGVGLSQNFLFGSWGLLYDGFFSVSGLLCGGLRLSGWGVQESLALGLILQFLIAFSAHFGWLW